MNDKDRVSCLRRINKQLQEENKRLKKDLFELKKKVWKIYIKISHLSSMYNKMVER